MKPFKLFLILFCVIGLTACSTPAEDASKAQKDASKAEEQKTMKRMELVEQYQSCMKENEGNKQKQEVCNSYLEASKALK